MVLYTVKNETALRRRIYSVNNGSWAWKVSIWPNVFSAEIFSPAQRNESKYVSDWGGGNWNSTYW